MKISALVSRGKNKGVEIYPCRHKDGMYVVSKTRYEKDYVRVGTLEEVASYVEKGYSVRMNNPDECVVPSSLISTTNIVIHK